MAVCIKDCIQNMNLVIGCTIGCSYCYARNNVRRFHMIDDFEKPEFFPNKLRLMEKKRPQNFLLTGMSDFSHWNTEWREQIFAKMTENPQHQYLFLTKRPENIVFSTTLENAWFGVTVTSSKEKNRIRTLREHIHGGHYHVTFSWSINTLDEGFKNDMDDAVSIKRRLDAMKQIYDAGIRTVCFIAPVFPGIRDFEAIFHQVRNLWDVIWLENLNLRGGFKKDIMDYICKKYPDLVPLYDAIYNKGDRSYFRGLEDQAERLAKENSCPFVDNELPYGRAESGHPVIVDYFYHEEVRGSENTGRRNPPK